MRSLLLAMAALLLSGSLSSAQTNKPGRKQRPAQKNRPTSTQPALATLEQGPSFVIMVGKDTAAIEHFVRTSTELSGDLRFKGNKDRIRYTAHLRRDGSSTSVDVTQRGESPGTFVFDAAAEKETVANAAKKSSRRPKMTVAPEGAYPSIGFSMALLEQTLRSKQPAVGQTAKVPVINIRTRGVGTMTIQRVTADSVTVQCDGCQRKGVSHELRFSVNRNGDITGGKNVSQRWTVSRVEPAGGR